MSSTSGIMLLIVVTVYLHVYSTMTTVDATNEPIIGILSLPCYLVSLDCAPAQVDFNATTYIPASYVKWIESGGGRVIPMLADTDHKYIQELLPTLNGVMFTGGAADINESVSFYYNQVINIIDYLRKYAKDSGQTYGQHVWDFVHF